MSTSCVVLSEGMGVCVGVGILLVSALPVFVAVGVDVGVGLAGSSFPSSTSIGVGRDIVRVLVKQRGCLTIVVFLFLLKHNIISLLFRFCSH